MDGVLVGGTISRGDDGKIKIDEESKAIIVNDSFPDGATINLENAKETGYLNNNVTYWKPGE